MHLTNIGGYRAIALECRTDFKVNIFNSIVCGVSLKLCRIKRLRCTEHVLCILFSLLVNRGECSPVP